MLSGHVVPALAKEVLEPPSRRDDLVYVHCATTEDEEVEDEEEEESKGLTRSRSWLCCPGDRRADKTVPIQVEADSKDKQNAVSFRFTVSLGRPGWRLSLLVGKYESNATALRLALSYSDRAIEAYDVLVALLESEIALSTERNSATIDNRRAAENVAYHVLNRLENDCANALAAPWEDSMVLSDESEVTWCVEDEQRLRRHISRLKGERTMVRSTAVELESVHAEPLNSKNTISLAEARKLDLETAVLMQELMAMREDKAELRARVFLLEKERATIELKLNARDTQIAAQHATIQHLQGQLSDAEAMLAMATNKDRGLSDNESEGMESELIEALGREARLKERLQELISTLDEVNKNSELRHQQSAELVNDLKRANGALVQTLEKSKKKYQSRLKKLEQQMLGMVERHAAQVKTLKQRITLLEEESMGYKGSIALQSQSSGASETSL
ncbi:Colorectal mutant cancer protein [Harpegnathos saltator]|uniref:Colorectal mutant cancer protein n=1 Tax=Harpegnathos saltator TaxID=610380 RepID=E2C705_HARSA|nr:Colorectal mutant cancer protein [Harpegnathos saltator]